MEDFHGLRVIDCPIKRSGNNFDVEFATEDGAYAMVLCGWRGRGLSMYAVGRAMVVITDQASRSPPPTVSDVIALLGDGGWRHCRDHRPQPGALDA